MNLNQEQLLLIIQFTNETNEARVNFKTTNSNSRKEEKSIISLCYATPHNMMNMNNFNALSINIHVC